MRAYLIDPFTETVTEVDYTGNYRNIYEHIGAGLFDTVLISEDRDTLFVDDEGLFVDPEKQRFFMVDTYAAPLAGKALCLGTDEEGGSVEPRMSIEQLRARVTFLPREFRYKRPPIQVFSW